MHEGLRAAACGALTLASVTAHADDFTNLGLGVDCSTGRYGTASTTRACALPAQFDVFRGPWELKVTAPWMASDTAGETVHGMSDASVYLAKALNGMPDWIDEVDLAGRVKFRNGDKDKSLGSGHMGYQPEIDVAKSWGPNLQIAFVGVTYVDAERTRKVSPYLTLWYKRQLTRDWKFGFMYENWNLANHASAVEDVVLIPEWKATSRLTFKPMVYKGLTRNTANFGAGLLATYRID